jgi:hypothetical protein
MSQNGYVTYVSGWEQYEAEVMFTTKTHSVMALEFDDSKELLVIHSVERGLLLESMCTLWTTYTAIENPLQIARTHFVAQGCRARRLLVRRALCRQHARQPAAVRICAHGTNALVMFRLRQRSQLRADVCGSRRIQEQQQEHQLPASCPPAAQHPVPSAL